MARGAFPFTGMLYRDWRRLRLHTSSISSVHRRRAFHVLLRSVLNEAMHAVDQRQFGARIAAQPVLPPLIVLGLARSGTTHLHQLLARDPRLAYPTFSQAFNPHAFLTREGHCTGWLAKGLRAINLLMSIWEYGFYRPSTRGFDAVPAAATAPEEDELALMMSCQSPNLSLAFPRDRQQVIALVDRVGWQGAWMKFLRKVSMLHPGRPLVLKSPLHLVRLPWILELFGEAKFVFICRRPDEVLASTLDIAQTLERDWRFQEFESDHLENSLVSGRFLIEAYLRDRSLIPNGHLHELSYEDLVRQPESELERLYAALGLPDFEGCRAEVRSALRERGEYQVNSHQPLPTWLRERLRQKWRPYYEAFGYH